jgi:hypothetical protein
MNYLEIVIQGYFNQNNREYLEKYFLREFKKAEKEEYFEADEFFNGCLKITEGWKKYLRDLVNERKRELEGMLNDARNGTLIFANMEGKTIDQLKEETIQYCIEELESIRPDGIGGETYYVHLSSLTKGRIGYQMEYDEVLQIEIAILKAFKKALENVLPQTTLKQNPKLSLKQIALIHIYNGVQITRDNGNEIAKEYGHKSGEKLYQDYTKLVNISDRKGDPGTGQKIKFQIRLLESVIELLPVDKRKQPNDELSILKGIYEAQYQ